MALTPEEEKKLREEIRKKLEAREERYRESKQKEEELRRQRLEDRLRAKIREEEEEKYYRERGYVQYKNRHGEVEWVTPEEKEKRQNSRRTRKVSSRRKRQKRKKMLRWATTALMLFLAVGVLGFLYRYNPKPVQKAGSIQIVTGISGARIFLDGKELNALSPDTLRHLVAGRHYVAVFKEGFSVWPPYRQVAVKPGGVTRAEFQLESSAIKGKVLIESNLPGYQIFVDGIPYLPAGAAELNLTAGMHVITALKKGYRCIPAYKRVLVAENTPVRIRFNFQETKLLGSIRVSSNMEDAYVYLNDQFTGLKVRGGNIQVPAGVYEVRIQKNGFSSQPASKIVLVEPNRGKLVVFQMSPVHKKRQIEVDTSTPGANILIDGEFSPYVTPMPALTLSRGTHYLNFSRDGRLYREKDLLVDTEQVAHQRLAIDF